VPATAPRAKGGGDTYLNGLAMPVRNAQCDIRRALSLRAGPSIPPTRSTALLALFRAMKARQ